MNFTLISYSKVNPSPGLGQEVRYQVLDPDDILKYSESNGYPTDVWLGKANSFTDLRGPDPSYAFLLVTNEVKKIALRYTGGGNTGTVEMSGQEEQVHQANQFDLEITLDELTIPSDPYDPMDNPYKTRLIKDLYVESVESITPSLKGDQSLYLLKLVDGRYLYGSQDAENPVELVDGVNETIAAPSFLGRPVELTLNKVEAWLRKEQLQEIFDINDSDYVDDYGRFLYSAESVKKRYPGAQRDDVWEQIDNTNPDKRIPKPLTWEEVIKSVLGSEAFIISDNTLRAKFPYFGSLARNAMEIEVDENINFPNWIPQNISIRERTPADVLRRLCLLTSTGIIYNGEGKFELISIEDDRDQSEQGFDLYMKKWVKDQGTLNKNHLQFNQIWNQGTAGDTEPPRILWFQSYERRGYDHLPCSVLGFRNKQVNDVHSLHYKKEFNTADHYIEFPLVLVPERGTTYIGGYTNKGAVDGDPQMPENEWAKKIYGINISAEYIEGMVGYFSDTQKSRYWHYPTKRYNIRGFRDIEVGPYVEKVSWYYLGEGSAGTYVQNVVPMTKRQLEGLSAPSWVPPYQGVSICYAEVVSGWDPDEDEDNPENDADEVFIVKNIVPIVGEVVSRNEGETNKFALEDEQRAVVNKTKGVFLPGDIIMIVSSEEHNSLDFLIDEAIPGIYYVLNREDTWRRMRLLEDYPYNVEDPDDPDSPEYNSNPDDKQFAIVATNQNPEGMEWKEVAADIDILQVTETIEQNLINNQEFITNVTNASGGGGGPKIYSALATDTGHTALVAWNSAFSISGILDPADHTGVAENVFDVPFMAGEPIVIIHGNRKVALKGVPNIIRARVSTEGGVANNGLAFQWDNPLVMVGHHNPAITSGEAKNSLGLDLERGQLVILAQNGLQWNLIGAFPFHSVVFGVPNAIVQRGTAQFTLTIQGLVEGVNPDITTITVTNEPEIETDVVSTKIYARYDRTAGAGLSTRWTTRDTGNEDLILKGKPNYAGDKLKVLSTDNGTTGWLNTLLLEIQVGVITPP